MRRRDQKDSDYHTDRGLLSRIIEGVILFVVLGFAIKFATEAIVSVKIPLIIISVVVVVAVIGYRFYKYWRDHNDY